MRLICRFDEILLQHYVFLSRASSYTHFAICDVYEATHNAIRVRKKYMVDMQKIPPR